MCKKSINRCMPFPEFQYFATPLKYYPTMTKHILNSSQGIRRWASITIKYFALQ